MLAECEPLQKIADKASDLMDTQGPRWPRVYWSQFMFVESSQNHVCITIWTKCLQYVLVHQKKHVNT